MAIEDDDIILDDEDQLVRQSASKENFSFDNINNNTGTGIGEQPKFFNNTPAKILGEKPLPIIKNINDEEVSIMKVLSMSKKQEIEVEFKLKINIPDIDLIGSMLKSLDLSFENIYEKGILPTIDIKKLEDEIHNCISKNIINKVKEEKNVNTAKN